MDQISHDPIAALIGGQVIAIAAAGMAAGTASVGAMTSLAPAGADEVSIQAMMAFVAEGVESLATQTAAFEELSRAGAAVIDIARRYAQADDDAASTLASAQSRIIASVPDSDVGRLADAAQVRRLAEAAATAANLANAAAPLVEQGTQIAQTVQSAVGGMSGTATSPSGATPLASTTSTASVRADEDDREESEDEGVQAPEGATGGPTSGAAAPVWTQVASNTTTADKQRFSDT